jgi:hypothetical protein
MTPDPGLPHPLPPPAAGSPDRGDAGLLTVAFSGSAVLASHAEAVWMAFLDAIAVLRHRLPQPPPYRFIHGDAVGADRIIAARLTAAGNHVTVLPADWAAHGQDAGWIRNRALIDTADAYIAIWDGCSTGTLHAAGLALDRDIPWECRIIQPPPHQGLPAHPQPWDEADPTTHTPHQTQRSHAA